MSSSTASLATAGRPTLQPGPLLRVPRTDTNTNDSEHQFILLRAQPSLSVASSPHRPLDLDLLATEGEIGYKRSIKHSRIHKFLRETYSGTQDELETILEVLLLGQPVKDEKDNAVLAGVAFSATLENETITLVLRRTNKDIITRIATIDIPQDQEAEIPLYEWVGQTCIARDAAVEHVQELRTKVSQQEKQISELVSQLKDLAKLKKDHEEVLLVKMQQLLNNKKSHIRALTRRLEASHSGQIPAGSPSPPPAPSSPGIKSPTTKNPRKRPNPSTKTETSNVDESMGASEDDESASPLSDQMSDPRTTDDEAEIATTGGESDDNQGSSRLQFGTRGKGKEPFKVAESSKPKSPNSENRGSKARGSGRGGARGTTAARGKKTTTRARSKKTAASESDDGDNSDSEKKSLPARRTRAASARAEQKKQVNKGKATSGATEAPSTRAKGSDTEGDTDDDEL